LTTTASPADGVVFVSGYSGVVLPAANYATIAYNALTGKRMWLRTYNGPAHGYGVASSMAVSSGGARCS
jgi:hypothetical protein